MEVLCKRIGVDPEDLVQKSRESFRYSKDDIEAVVNLRYEHHETRRRAKIEALRKIVVKEMQNALNQSANAALQQNKGQVIFPAPQLPTIPDEKSMSKCAVLRDFSEFILSFSSIFSFLSCVALIIY
jgi:hypothetical protein